MITRENIVVAARRWKDTPYAEQGRDSVPGLDCGGLIIVVCNELKITRGFDFLGYRDSPDGQTFEQLLDENLDRVEPKNAVLPGDIVACDYGKGIQHTAFVVEVVDKTVKVVHAVQGGYMRVVEQNLHGRHLRGWVRTYRVRGLANG